MFEAIKKSIRKWLDINTKMYNMTEERFVEYCRLQNIDGGIGRKHFNISRYMNSIR